MEFGGYFGGVFFDLKVKNIYWLDDGSKILNRLGFIEVIVGVDLI